MSNNRIHFKIENGAPENECRPVVPSQGSIFQKQLKIVIKLSVLLRKYIHTFKCTFCMHRYCIFKCSICFWNHAEGEKIVTITRQNEKPGCVLSPQHYRCIYIFGFGFYFYITLSVSCNFYLLTRNIL